MLKRQIIVTGGKLTISLETAAVLGSGILSSSFNPVIVLRREEDGFRLSREETHADYLALYDEQPTVLTEKGKCLKLLTVVTRREASDMHNIVESFIEGSQADITQVFDRNGASLVAVAAAAAPSCA